MTRGTLSLARRLHHLACAVLILLLVAAGGTHLSEEDEWGPAGVHRGFSVISVPSGMDERRFVDIISRGAKSHDLNVYKAASSSRHSETSTVYYVFIGNASTVLGDPAERKFPSFGSRFSATMEPARDLDAATIPGTYLVQGDSADASALHADLARLGIRAEPFTGSPSQLRWIGFLIRTPFGLAMLVLWCAAFATAAHLRSARLAVSSLRTSLGEHPLRNLWPETAALGAPLLVAALAPSVLLAAYSLIFRGGYRALQALSLALPLGILVLLVTAAVVTAFAVFQKRTLLGSIFKGARPHALVTVLCAIAIAVASAAALHTGASALHAVADERDARLADAFRAEHRELFRPVVGYAILGPDADRIHDGQAAAAASLEPERAVWLCDGQSLDGDGPGPTGSATTPIVIMNTTYFEHLPGVDRRLADSVAAVTRRTGGAALVSPTTIPADARRRAQTEAGDWLDFQTSLRPEGGRATPHVTSLSGHDLGIVPLLDQFRLGEQTYRRNPTVLVVNVDSKLLSARNIAVSTSYTDPGRFRTLMNAQGVGYAIVSMDNVARLSELDAADRAETMRFLLLGTAAMAVSLALAAGILAATSFARRTPQIFLQSSTGMPFWSIHRVFLLSTALLTCMPAIGVALASDLSFVEGAALVGTIAVVTLACATGVLGLQQGTAHRTGLEQT